MRRDGPSPAPRRGDLEARGAARHRQSVDASRVGREAQQGRGFGRAVVGGMDGPRIGAPGRRRHGGSALAARTAPGEVATEGGIRRCSRGLRYPIGTSGQTLVVDVPVLAHFERHRQIRWWQREAGGQLFSRVEGEVITIVEATGPRLGDRRTRHSYEPDRRAEQVEIDDRHPIWPALRRGLAHAPRTGAPSIARRPFLDKRRLLAIDERSERLRAFDRRNGAFAGWVIHGGEQSRGDQSTFARDGAPRPQAEKGETPLTSTRCSYLRARRGRGATNVGPQTRHEGAGTPASPLRRRRVVVVDVIVGRLRQCVEIGIIVAAAANVSDVARARRSHASAHRRLRTYIKLQPILGLREAQAIRLRPTRILAGGRSTRAGALPPPWPAQHGP